MLSGADKFKETIKIILTEKIGQEWQSVNNFDLFLHSQTCLSSMIKKRKSVLIISIVANDFSEDPVVTFKIVEAPALDLRYHSIRYLNGVVLKFKTRTNSGDVAPQDLDGYFYNWTRILDPG